MIIYSGGFTVMGGIERVISNLVNYLTQHNNSFEFVSICNAEDYKKDVIDEFKHFNVIRYKSKTNSRILKIFQDSFLELTIGSLRKPFNYSEKCNKIGV